MSARVVVYSTEYCPYCTRAKALLSKKGAAYEEIMVDERPDLRSWLAQATNQRTVPQVFVNGRPLGGFTDLVSLDRQGRLDPLLAAPPTGAEAALRV
jgi:glutaredoxin 3